MNIMVEEEVVVRIGANGTPVMGRSLRISEVKTRLRQIMDPNVIEVRGLTKKEAKRLARQITSKAHGEITGPKRRRAEKELQKPS